jgi:alkylation response protein AidB-like acyl-CoA dehydrogenase
MIRVAAMNAADAAVAVTRTAGLLGGGSAIYATSALQRHTRDAEALRHHFSLGPAVWEDAGRVFMGRKPNAPMF